MGAKRIETENYRYRLSMQNPASANPDQLLVIYEAQPASLLASVHEIQEERL